MVEGRRERKGIRTEQRYFIPTACGVKGHVCQLCRLHLARILCQQELYRVDASLSMCQPACIVFNERLHSIAKVPLVSHIL